MQSHPLPRNKCYAYAAEGQSGSRPHCLLSRKGYSPVKYILEKLQSLEKLVIALGFAIMVVASFIQVVNRNVFKIPVTGFEEASKYAMVYMVLLATELGLRDGTQISINGVVDKLHGLFGRIVRIVSKLIVIIFSSVMLRAGIAMVTRQFKINQTSPGLGMPMWIPYMAIVLGFGLITIVQFAALIKLFVTKEGGK